MNFNDYQKQALTTADYKSDLPDWAYLTLGLVSESGEVADKFKKVIRNKRGHFDEEEYLKIKKELGDVMWYVANLAHAMGFKLDDVAQYNLAKLADRKERDVIRSTGDNR